MHVRSTLGYLLLEYCKRFCNLLIACIIGQMFYFLLAASRLFARKDLRRVYLAGIVIADDILIVYIDDASVSIFVLFKKLSLSVVSRFLAIAGIVCYCCCRGLIQQEKK